MWKTIKNLITRTAGTATTIVNTADETMIELGKTTVRQAALLNATHAMNSIKELEELGFDEEAVTKMDDYFAKRRAEYRNQMQ